MKALDKLTLKITAMEIKIKLVLPDSEHRAQVSQFIEEQYYKRMNLVPPLPQILFAAFHGHTVVATVALEFSSHEGELLPCETLFLFDHTLLHYKAPSTLYVQYSRWVATEERVSKSIVLFATNYAIACGKQYGWCELKPHTAKRLRMLGVLLFEVQDATIVLENVHESVRPYYTSYPLPALYQLDLNQMASVLI